MNFGDGYIPAFAGAGLGLLAAVLVAWVQYRRYRSKHSPPGMPGVVFPVAGCLGLVGLVAVAFSLFVSKLGEMLQIGVAVLGGFIGGLLLIGLLWAVRSHPEQSE